MEGAVRLFAGEFSRASLSVPGEHDPNTSYVVTPSGAWCGLVFVAGALTERNDLGEFLSARVADPTGGFDLSVSGRDSELFQKVQKLPLPSFISVLGRAQLYQRSGRTAVSIRPEKIVAIDRSMRDQWVLATAVATLERIRKVNLALLGENSPDIHISGALRYYRTSKQDLLELATMAGAAVRNVRPDTSASSEKPDVKLQVLEYISASKDPRGIAVQEILDVFIEKAIPQQSILSAIEALITEDECYQPQKGFVRLL